MRWLLKGVAGGTLVGLLHFTPKTHLRVSDRPILDLRQAQEPFICRHMVRSHRWELWGKHFRDV